MNDILFDMLESQIFKTRMNIYDNSYIETKKVMWLFQ